MTDIAVDMTANIGPANISSLEWPEPEPLPRALVAVDAFDDAWLPETVRPWIVDISERIQCPPDFPAVGAMVSLANTLGRKIAVRPKQYDDWMEVPNLWGAVVGRPGIMKSPALAESMRPLNRLAMDAQKQHQEAIDTAESGTEIRAANIKALRSDLVKACKEKDTKSADDIAAEMNALKADDETEPCRRFKVNDATVEKLGELLAENPNGLLMFRDELVGWLRALVLGVASCFDNALPFHPCVNPYAAFQVIGFTTAIDSVGLPARACILHKGSLVALVRALEESCFCHSSRRRGL